MKVTVDTGRETAAPRAVAPSEGRHNSHSLHLPLLRYVERVLGEAGLRDALRRSGLATPLEALMDPTQWCSYDDTRRLLEAFDVLLGREAFRVGARFFERGADVDGAEDMLATFQSLGGPAGILGAIAESASKFTSVIALEAGDITASSGVVTARVAPAFESYTLLCEVTAGLLSQSSLVFGLPLAMVVEERCVHRGDDCCRFRVRWETEQDPAARAAQWEQELAGVRSRFSSLRSTVADLVSGHDVDAVLERIVDRAARAVRVPRYVLAVRTTDDTPVRVHAIGFDGDDVASIAAELLDERGGSERASRLVADIRSSRRYYGRLAAFNVEGVGFFPEEQSNLTAYAELAAAALDSATAIEEARRQGDTAQALLGLAQAVAEVSTREGVAARLAAAVPQVVGSTSAGVMLWDGERLVTSASQGLSEETIGIFDGFAVRLDDTPRLRDAIERREPYFIDAADASGELAEVLSANGTKAVVLVPIHVQDRLYGVVSAGVEADVTHLRNDDDLIGRLSVLAALAATAFQNADLVETIRHQSQHDPLTGLPNQRLLEQCVEQALANAHASAHAAMLFIDLDRFKNVNDTLGHVVGDGILNQVAKRLLRAVREPDVVARLGGDEFAVLLPALEGTSEAEAVAERLLTALQRPFQVAGHDVFINASIGIALAPGDGSSYAELLRSADAAMYSAKAAGRGTRRTYKPDMAARSTDDLGLEADLHMAVERDELRLVFQPQLDLRSMRVVRAEALVRWQHPERGLLPPDAFIALAEETGLVTAVDTWVMRGACTQLAAWRAAGFRDLDISVNVSERDLRDPSFVERVAAIVDEAGIGAGSLELEITERVAETADEEMAPVLDGLRQLGVRIAIDDFGTGNSAFSRLLRGRIDTLKIDKSFLHELTGSGDDAPFVTAMIALGHSLDMTVVAEGVENAKQGAFVRRAGCDLAQGFYLSAPVDAATFEALIARIRR